MRAPFTPRPEILDIYWSYAAERQAIFERRLAGISSPWTSDPILATYKFCNVFRATDRVSQYLIRSVAYRDGECDEDRIFQIVAFRIFSWPDTWERLIRSLGHPPRIADLSSGAFERALDEHHATGEKIFTGAFILCATDVFGRGTKHRNYAALLHHMFVEDDVARRILHATSLRAVFDELHAYPLLGIFMAYQLAIDLNYSSLLSFSENDFTCAGPGALRGIRKVYASVGDATPEEVIHAMVEGQDEAFRSRGLTFHGLFGRPLHAIDCQGLFCEVDKYCRVARPELTSARVRMKAAFRPSLDPHDLFLPPKWGVTISRSPSRPLAVD